MKPLLDMFRKMRFFPRTSWFIVGWFFCFCIFSVAAQQLPPQYFNPNRKTSSASPAVAGTSRYGGTLVWGTVNAPTIINPILTQNSISSALLGLIFDSLVKIDSHDRIIPDLAESWELSPDGRTYVFHLRKGVRFHDGVELTSEDVKFTFDAVADEKNQSPFRMVNQVNGQWEAIDKYTVKLVLRSPDPIALQKILKEIAPKHLLENKDLRAASFNYRPVGTGPFKFSKWDRVSNQIELEANTEYFDGRPFLDKILVRIYPDNNHLWAALMRREVDFVRYLNPEDYTILSADPAFRTYATPSDSSCVILYNLHDPILADIQVRKAIAMGIDVEKILRGIPAQGIISLGPFQSSVDGFNPQVKPIVYDPAQAMAILDAKGWRDSHHNGIVEKDGQPLELRMLVDGRSEYLQRIAMLLRQQLSEIGIKVVVRLYKDETVLTKEYLEADRIQAWLRFFRSAGDDPGMILEHWKSSQYPVDDLWNYQDPKVDELVRLTNNTKDDRERIQIFQDIHRVIYEDQPALFLFSPLSLHAVSKRMQNTDDYFSANTSDYMIGSWRIGDGG